MPKQLVVHAWCDPCYANDEHTEGEILVLAVGNRKARELVLCERHRKDLFDPLNELLSKAPVAGGDASPAPSAPRQAQPRTSTGKASTQPATDAPEGHMSPPMTEWPEDLPEPRTGPEGETIFWCPPCQEAGDKAEFSTKDRRRPAQSIRLHLRQQHRWDV